eukprot:gnl/MRDRNA2_/MRDRNA2_93790_c0_seq1.p1 gnl/MRDRNA2_/MRDRNA2_93790_c0~~gnl/MRDRNA2_/MRDRNA2_93790_c0_seq1.p1  ORF type:complete len:433 (+),score=75.26 gnl/MRDRNA2_/MRDRNA2_93790_c0_seq1:159-1301(+)
MGLVDAWGFTKSGRKEYINDIGQIPEDVLWRGRAIIGDWIPKSSANTSLKEVPTRQPQTISQAEQICASSKMPQNIFFSEGSTEDGAFGGRWMTRDGAELVQWTEDPLAWQPGTLRLNVAGIRLASVVPQEIDEEDIKERWKARGKKVGGLKLRGDQDHIAAKKNFLSEDKVVIRDCDDQLLYTLWATKRFPRTVEIYNREKILLAKGVEVDPALEGRPTRQRYWLFNDPKGKELAKAATPQLDEIRRGPPSRDNVVPWEMLFDSADPSPASVPRVMAAPNERWVVAAALQWRTFQDMDKPRQSSVLAAFPPPLVMICVILFSLGFCFLTRLVFSCIFDLVYPPKRDENRNLYLFDWMMEVYGELVESRIKYRVSTRPAV